MWRSSMNIHAKHFAILEDLEDDRREILLERVVEQMEEFASHLWYLQQMNKKLRVLRKGDLPSTAMALSSHMIYTVADCNIPKYFLQ